MKNLNKAVKKRIKIGSKKANFWIACIFFWRVQNEYFLVAFGVANGVILASGRFDTGVARERIKKNTKKYDIKFLLKKSLF